ASASSTSAGPISAPMANSGERLIGVDLLRALSVGLVLGTHWLTSLLPASPAAGIDRLAEAVFRRRALGVTLFFVISCFLITRTTMLREADLYRLSIPRFYGRRA